MQDFKLQQGVKFTCEAFSKGPEKHGPTDLIYKNQRGKVQMSREQYLRFKNREPHDVLIQSSLASAAKKGSQAKEVGFADP